MMASPPSKNNPVSKRPSTKVTSTRDGSPPVPRPRLSTRPSSGFYDPVPSSENFDTDDYLQPAEWTGVTAGTVKTRVDSLEDLVAETSGIGNSGASSTSNIGSRPFVNRKFCDEDRSVERNVTAGKEKLRSDRQFNPENESRHREVSTSTTSLSQITPGAGPRVATIPSVPGLTVHGDIVGHFVGLGGQMVCHLDPASHRDTVDDRSSKNNKTDRKSKEAAEYIEAVNSEMKRNTSYDVRGSFREYLQPLPEAYPTCSLTTLGRSCLSVHSHSMEETDEVTLDNLLGSLGDHSALLLGGPGDGKTVAGMRYARLVHEKKVPELEHVEMVHYIEGAGLQVNKECKPFDLLFTHQLEENLPDKVTNAGEGWVRENTEKVLLVLDALDKIVKDGPEGKIALITKAKAFTIILNLLRGNIYKNMWILCTSRWNWIWSLPRRVLPSRKIELKGFSPDDAKRHLSGLIRSEKQQLMCNVIARYPKILKLCQIPMFLIHVAITLTKLSSGSEDECVPTQQVILMQLLRHLKTCPHALPRDPAVVQNAMAIGYQSSEQRVLTLSHAQLKTKEKVAEMEQIIIGKPDPDHFEETQEFLEDYQMHYTFRSELLRDMLAALHVIVQDKPRFKEIVNAALNANMPSNVLTLVFGTVMDDKLAKFVGDFTNGEVRLEEKRRVLLKILTGRLANTLSDILTLHLLNSECKWSSSAIQKNAPADIKLTKVSNPADGHAALYVASKYPKIRRLRCQHLCLDSASVNLLLRQATAIEVDSLEITGQPTDFQLERLGNFFKKSSRTKTCKLSDYGISCDIQTRTVEVDTLKGDDADFFARFIHRCLLKATVSMKSYLINGERKGCLAEMQELDDLASKSCSFGSKFEVEVLDINGNANNIGKMLNTILTRKSKVCVKKVKHHGTILSTKLNKSGLGLVLNEALTEADILMDVISEGNWRFVESKDFSVGIHEEKKPEGSSPQNKCESIRRKFSKLEVFEDFSTDPTSYANLCKFMIRLKCDELLCTDVNLLARCDASGENCKLILNMDRTVYTDEYRFEGFCQFVLKSKASEVRFVKAGLVAKSSENGAVLKIKRLNGTDLKDLELLLSVPEISEVFIKQCLLSNACEETERIVALSERTKLHISHLNVLDDIVKCAAEVYVLRTKVFFDKANVGTGGTTAVIYPPGEITIAYITTKDLVALLTSWISQVVGTARMHIRELEEKSMEDHGVYPCIDEVHRLLTDAAQLLVTKIDEISVNGIFDNVAETIMKLSSVATIGKVTTENVEFEAEYDNNGKIRVTLREITMEDLNTFFRHAQTVSNFDVKKCEMITNRGDADSMLASFVTSLMEGPFNCSVETLHVNVSLRDVFRVIRDLMLQGKVLKVVSHVNTGIAITRDSEKEIFRLVVSERHASDLETLTADAGFDFTPEEINIDTFIVGVRGQASLMEMIATAGGIPEDMRRSVMDFTRLAGQRKVEEHLKLLDTFSSENPQLKINLLNIKGDLKSFEDVLKLMVKMSIPSVTTKEMTIQLKPDVDEGDNVSTLSRLTLDHMDLLQQLQNCGWKVQIKELDLMEISTSENAEKFATAKDLFQHSTVKANVIKCSSELSEITDELLFLLEHLSPEVIVTGDYEMKFEYLPDQKIQLNGEKTRDCLDTSGEVFRNFANLANAEISVPGYYERYDGPTEVEETIPKVPYSSDATSTVSIETEPEYTMDYGLYEETSPKVPYSSNVTSTVSIETEPEDTMEDELYENSLVFPPPPSNPTSTETATYAPLPLPLPPAHPPPTTSVKSSPESRTNFDYHSYEDIN